MVHIKSKIYYAADEVSNEILDQWSMRHFFCLDKNELKKQKVIDVASGNKGTVMCGIYF